MTKPDKIKEILDIYKAYIPPHIRGALERRLIGVVEGK